MSRKNKSYPAELKYQAVADYLSGVNVNEYLSHVTANI